MSEVKQAFIHFFTSLRLTVVLLVLSMVLVFVATLAQVQLGIVGVQERFFRTFFVLAFWGESRIPVPVYPGGYLIGGLLMINLISSFLYRFKFTTKKIGIHLTHVGLIVLLVGELITGLLQEDFALTLNEGESKAYSEAFRDHELAIIDTTLPDYDEVVAIPESIVAKGDAIQHPKLPFRVLVHGYYPNANLTMRGPTAPEGPTHFVPNPANQGLGPRVAVTPLPITYRDDERNLPTAFVELMGTNGSLGT